MGRNWKWSYQQGREQRLAAERQASLHNASAPECPFFSFEPTMNSYFAKGWHSVTQCEINTHKKKAQPPASVARRLSRLKELRQCHFSQ